MSPKYVTGSKEKLKIMNQRKQKVKISANPNHKMIICILDTCNRNTHNNYKHSCYFQLTKQ